MQVLNVALGGTLYQDLPSQWDGDVLKHRQATPKWQPHARGGGRDGSYIAEVMGRDRGQGQLLSPSGDQRPRRRAGRHGPFFGRGDRGRGGEGPLASGGCSASSGTPRRCAERARNRRASSRPTSRRRSATPCAGPRPREGQPRERPAGYTQGHLRNHRRPRLLGQVHPGARRKAAPRRFAASHALHARARRYPCGRAHQGYRPGSGPGDGRMDGGLPVRGGPRRPRQGGHTPAPRSGRERALRAVPGLEPRLPGLREGARRRRGTRPERLRCRDRRPRQDLLPAPRAGTRGSGAPGSSAPL